MLNFLIASDCQGLPTVSNMFEIKLSFFFQIVCYLSAEYTARLAESPEVLQRQIVFIPTIENGKTSLHENRQNLCITTV